MKVGINELEETYNIILRREGARAEAPESLSFIDSTAKATGKGRTTVSLDAERGGKINGNALDAVAGTALDKGVKIEIEIN